MTRLIRIELCDECPHAAGSRSCRATTWCDEGGIIRPDGRGGLRVTIEEVEHWFAPVDAARLLQENAFAFLYDPDPAPLLRCEPRRRTGHVFPSNPAGAETPHLLITVYLCGVEGAEREGSLRKGGGESGAPSSLSRRTGILYAGGGPT